MINELFLIEGMSCQHCVMALKKELSELEVVIKSVEVGKAEVAYDPAKTGRDKIIQAIEEAGFRPVN